MNWGYSNLTCGILVSEKNEKKILRKFKLKNLNYFPLFKKLFITIMYSAAKLLVILLMSSSGKGTG